MKRTVRDRLMPYRVLAGLLALILAGGLAWYGAILLLAPRSGVRGLRDLTGQRDALRGVTLAGRVEDDVFAIPFTVDEGRVKNRFVPLDGGSSGAGGSLYYNFTAMPAPGANTSDPVLVTQGDGWQYYGLATDEIAYYLNVWGTEGRELILFDTGIRCSAAGARYHFTSSGLMIGSDRDPLTWSLSFPEGEGWTQADQDAYYQACDLTPHWAMVARAGAQDFVLLSTGGETKVFLIERWGSSLDIRYARHENGHTFVDYTQPVGSVRQTDTLPGALCAASPAGEEALAAVTLSNRGLAAFALDAAGCMTAETLLLPAAEAGENCRVSAVQAVSTGFADVGLLIDPDAPDARAVTLPMATAEAAGDAPAEDPEAARRCPWAAALRIENGRFTARELLPLTAAAGADQFLAAGLDETGTRLVTVQQLRPVPEEQPPAGVRGANFHLAGEISLAVRQQGETLYEGILQCDWREDAWRYSPSEGNSIFGEARRRITFGSYDPYGQDEARAGATFFQPDEEVEYR